jgi:predicted double-glycine peptidase
MSVFRSSFALAAALVLCGASLAAAQQRQMPPAERNQEALAEREQEQAVQADVERNFYDRAPIRDSQRRFRLRVRSWKEIKQQNIVMQKRDFSCGAAALATIVRYYWEEPVGEEVFLRDLAKMLGPKELAEREKSGLTLTDLKDLAVRHGYQAAMGKVSFEELTESKIPLLVGITHNEFDHFVVYRGWDGYYVYLADPTRGNIRVPAWRFVEEWQKNAILLVVKPGGKPHDSPLAVTERETHVGDMNWQVIRTFPTHTGQ